MVKGSEFTVEERKIFRSLLPKFTHILESKKSDVSTLKEKNETWNKIADLLRSRTGKARSSSYLRMKYQRIKKNWRKVPFINCGGSPSHQMLLSSDDGSENGVYCNRPAFQNTYGPELVITIDDDPLKLPMSTQGTIEERDPLQLTIDNSQDALVENDPLELPAEAVDVDPLAISHLTSEDCFKMDSMFKKKMNNNYLIKIKEGFNQAKDKFCEPKTKYTNNERIELQKRMLEIEEARNEREKILLQIEIERNEREKRLFHIQEERNEREKQILIYKAERVKQNDRIVQLERQMVEQNKIIVQLEEARNEQEKRIIFHTAERSFLH